VLFLCPCILTGQYAFQKVAGAIYLLLFGGKTLERASGQSPTGARGAGGVNDINHQQEWHAILPHNKDPY